MMTWHFITEEIAWWCSPWVGWGAWMECSWRGPPFLCRRTSAYPSRSLCAASSVTHMSPGTLHAEDALRTVLNVGLHHCCRLQRGGCNPILCGGAVVQPVRRKRTLLCALTLSPPLLPFQPRVTLFLPHLFTPCSLRLVGGAQTSGIVASHCSPSDRASFLSRRDTALPLIFLLTFFFFFFFLITFTGESTACTPARWRARACSHQRQRRIYLRVHCPHTVTSISPPRTQIWTSTIVTKKRGGNTPDYKDGVLRHFKDDFLQSE